MRYRLIGSLSLLATLASTAVAQDPFTEKFKFLTSGSNASGYQGEFTSATNIGLTGVAINSPFQIWCIDPLDGVSSSSVDAWVTPLFDNQAPVVGPQANFTKTFTGGASNTLSTFQKAAFVASKMGTNTSGNNAAGFSADDYQRALWAIMGYSGYYTGDAKTIVDGITAANIASVDLTMWGVINDYNGSYTTGHYQEFLYCKVSLAQCTNGGGGGLSVTPEPATMSLMAMGMVSMAGAAVRRRRQRKA